MASGDGQPIPEEIALTIYNVLVETCGANEYWRDEFVRHQTKGCFEYRLSSKLGFGGKFWNANGRWYVNCYSEDETTARCTMMDEANARLKKLRDAQ
jgi:hypothetical protein